MRLHRVVLGIIAAALLLAGCQEGSSPSFSRDASAPAPAQMMEAATGGVVEEEPAIGEGNPLDVLQRQIIRSAALVVEVDDVGRAAEATRGIVVKVGGFVADSHASEDDAGRTSVNVTLRVPSPRLDETVRALKSLGHVRDEQVLGEDVTEQMVDLEARLANAKRLEARLIDLLGRQTKDLKDVLDAERELSRVRESIEMMEGRKRLLENRVSLATIELTLTAPPGWGRGIFDPLAGSLQRSLSAFTGSLAWLFIILSAAIPWIGLFLLFSWLGLRFLRWWIRKKREAKAKKPEANSMA